jgi:4-amino-4-deoxy-L-arabinose transferase-like glycosyltransferase
LPRVRAGVIFCPDGGSWIACRDRRATGILESTSVLKERQIRLTPGEGWATPAAVVLVILATYLSLAGRTTLWDRDEPRFARAAAEMLQSHNYLIITFNDESWPDKPVLTYWAMALAMRLLGPTAFACRLFGVVGTALACAATFYIGRRLLDRRAGLWAMLALASTLQILVIGSAATSDAILLPFTIGAMAVFAHARQTGVRPAHMILIGVATGLAMLVKGPMGLMPALAIVVIGLLERKDRRFRRASLATAGVSIGLGTAIFCAWAVPSSVATGGEFLRVFVGRHVIGRALSPMEHHGGNRLLYLLYYVPVVIGGFFPWTLHLPGALVALAHGRVGGHLGRRFFLGWIVPPFVVMSLAATKLPHYIVFLWPALALIVGGVIVAAQRGLLTSKDRDWLRGGVWFFGPLALLLGLGLIVGPWFVPISGLRWWGGAAGVVVLMTMMLAIREHLLDRPQRSAFMLIAGMAVLQVPLQCGILPALEQVKVAPVLAREVNARTDRNVPVAAYGYREPTLNFYVSRHIEPLSSQDAAIAWAASQEAGVLIITRDKLDEIHGPLSDSPMTQIASVQGWDYSKGKKIEVVALLRGTEKE